MYLSMHACIHAGDLKLAPALLCLDAPWVRLGDNATFEGNYPGAPRLSALGASLLATLLRYSQGACRAFTDSVAGLHAHDAAR